MRWLWKSLALVGAASSAFFIFAILLPSFLGSTYSAPINSNISGVVSSAAEIKKAVTHIPTPEPLKAIYMTACVASSQSWREVLKSLIEETELNALVIDIKDYTGVVSFQNNFPKSNLGKGCVVPDMKEFIEELHNRNIYVIGRISVFQDLSYVKIFPELAVKKVSTGEVWKDHKGLTFVDVGARPYWDYIISIAKESYEIGFDELNFDYVRYPSDGNMLDAIYPWTASSTSSTTPISKSDMLQSFFKYLRENLDGMGAKLSVDLFGMTTTVENDMNIGQLLEKALPYFDYIAPMVYPSHYPPNWNAFTNPADHPYEVIKIAMSKGVQRELKWKESVGIATSTPSKMRPWIQDFNLGATYDAPKIRAQIQATYDVGLTSWMLWNAGNKYTKEALLPN